MRLNPPNSRARSGFTLIELLVVLAIIGILVIAGTSAMGSRGPRSVKSLTVQIKGAIQEARALALSSGRSITLQATWNASTNSGSIIAIDDTTSVNKLMNVALDASFLRYCQPTSDGGISLPTTSPDVKSLKAVENFGWTSTTNGWTNHLFNSTAITFAPSGNVIDTSTGTALTGGFFVGVVGKSKNLSGVPVGVVLVSDQGRILSFYKSDSASGTGADSLWQRVE